MSITPRFIGIVRNGTVFCKTPGDFKKHITSLEGKEVDIVIGKLKTAGTSNQMRYLYGVVFKIISEHTGYDVEEVKEVLKQELLPPVKVIQFIDKETGEVISHSIYPSLADLDKAELSRFIDDSIRLAAQHWGLEIPEAARVCV